MNIKAKYIVKEKVIHPFDYATWIMWCLIPLIGIIIGYILCNRKYFLILEANEGKDYEIKKIQVGELDFYKVVENETVVEQDTDSYWAEKEKNYVKINVLG